VRTPALTAQLRLRLVNGLASLPCAVQRRLAGPAVVIDGQQLDLETQLWLKLLALADAPDRDAMTVTEVRAMVADGEAVTQGRRLDGVRVRELMIDGAAGEIAARLYVPDRAATPEPDERGDALLVFYHGGGFVVCDLDTHDNPCRFIAHHAGVRVLSVDYRLAPEHRFPAAFDDAVAAFRFAVAHAGELGVDPARIGVGGDSAGGNLAAGVARVTAADNGPAPVLQVLLYPWLDLADKRASYRLFGEGFDLTDADLKWFTRLYVPEAASARDPHCSPSLADDIEGVAPAYVATAGFDPLRDEAEEYARRLRDAGVVVALRRHPGLIHGFLNLMAIGHSNGEAILEAAGAVRFGLAGG
jgi:acetyl esterase